MLIKSDLRNKELADMLVEKHVKEHIFRRLSTQSESEKVRYNILMIITDKLISLKLRSYS